MSRPPSEEDLIEAYRRTVRPLYAYVSRRVGGDASLAEDFVQDAWMRAIGDWTAKGSRQNPSPGWFAWRGTVSPATFVVCSRINEQRDVLLGVFEQRAAIAMQRLALANQQLLDAQERVSIGVERPETVADLRFKVKEAEGS